MKIEKKMIYLNNIYKFHHIYKYLITKCLIKLNLFNVLNKKPKNV